MNPTANVNGHINSALVYVQNAGHQSPSYIIGEMGWEPTGYDAAVTGYWVLTQ